MTLQASSQKYVAAPAKRYDRAFFAAAAERHDLYMTVRSHLHAGWNQLPEGLTPANLSDLAVIARSRGDVKLGALCRFAHHAQIAASAEVA
jgi:hypothetical protein